MIDLGKTPASSVRSRGAKSRRGAQLVRVPRFGFNPGDLGMSIHIPPGLAPGAPLVVALHGCGQTAQAYAEGSGWLALADRLGFALLCPEQSAANNPNRCFNWFEPGDTSRDAGEAASIREMISHVVTGQGLDPARVFVTGLSAGGGMTAVMLATYPEVFAAGAVVAGLPYGAAANVQEAFAAMFQGRSRPARDWGDKVRAASSHAGPWPRLSIWHGDADATVRPGAAEDLTSQWTDLHGLPDLAEEARSASGRPYLAWRSETGETVVELHRLPGVGHGVPLSSRGEDGCGVPGPFLLEVGVSSSLEIAVFWGLAQARQPSLPEHPAPLPAPPAADGWRFGGFSPPRGAPNLDVGEVIADALRTAGLMK